MIKILILDVDGIIVGEKIGYNSPYPHADVIARLRSIEAKGIPISLCTGKPHSSIQKIIKDANLHNLHITDGGGVVIDPINNVVLKSHVISKDIVKEVLRAYLAKGVYTELYTVDGYYIQSDQKRALTDTHTHVLQSEPEIVDSLQGQVNELDVVKIMPIAKDDVDKEALTTIFQKFNDSLTLSWGVHPVANPHQFGIITAKGVSKAQATVEIAQFANLKTEEMLGIGDSTSDWQFMEQCGYAGTLSNGTKELKDSIATKQSRGFIANHSVDSNGILAVLDYFSL
jgi:HAD superfamily hydrolase (TIGR01484 family)